MEKAWLYGTMIVNINDNKDYTIQEVKGMERGALLTLITPKKEGSEKGQTIGGTSKLAEDIKGISQATIWNHIQCLYLEDDSTRIGNPCICY